MNSIPSISNKSFFLFMLILLMLHVIVYVLTGFEKTIDAKEAEDIAIQSAISEGYSNPRLFTGFNNETDEAYHYSNLKNKDVKTWRVTLITDEREQPLNVLGDIVYFIDSENGEIIDKISGVN